GRPVLGGGPALCPGRTPRSPVGRADVSLPRPGAELRPRTGAPVRRRLVGRAPRTRLCRAAGSPPHTPPGTERPAHPTAERRLAVPRRPATSPRPARGPHADPAPALVYAPPAGSDRVNHDGRGKNY